MFALKPDWEKDGPGVERVNGLWQVAYYGNENPVDQIYKKHPRRYTRYAELGKDSLEYSIALDRREPAFGYFFKLGMIAGPVLAMVIPQAYCEDVSEYLKYVPADFFNVEGYPIFWSCSVGDRIFFTRLKATNRRTLANSITRTATICYYCTYGNWRVKSLLACTIRYWKPFWPLRRISASEIMQGKTSMRYCQRYAIEMN